MLVKERKKTRADSSLTREKILATSITLFGERGFDGTSMRAMADAAGVNLAAMNYHFGSKVLLFEASFQECAAPINSMRNAKLDELEIFTTSPSVAQLVRAFVDVGIIGGEHPVPLLLSRIFAEPASLSEPLLARVFAPTVERFMKAFCIALPHVEEEELKVRFHFLVGSMLQLARFGSLPAFGAPVRALVNYEQRIDQLVDFVTAGLCQISAELN